MPTLLVAGAATRCRWFLAMDALGQKVGPHFHSVVPMQHQIRSSRLTPDDIVPKEGE